MTDHDKEQQFIDNVKKALDLGTDHLDAGTQSQLTRMRHRALDAGGRRDTFAQRWFTLPNAAWAAAAVLVLALAITLKQPGSDPGAWEDIDILAAEDNLEFYDSLEFYAWLAEEETGEPTDAG